jgi:hypothetical protein
MNYFRKSAGSVLFYPSYWKSDSQSTHIGPFRQVFLQKPPADSQKRSLLLRTSKRWMTRRNFALPTFKLRSCVFFIFGGTNTALIFLTLHTPLSVVACVTSF